MFTKVNRCLAVALAIGVSAAMGLSDRQPSAAAEGVLAVSATAPAPLDVDLDLAAIAQMPKHQVVTATPWTEGVSTFEGVLLRDLMRQLGVAGSEVRFVALNDYAITIPAADFEAYDVILAYARDGEAMPVRDKGPLWVIYPLDSHPELNGKETHSKMIWQVRRMEVM
jgi:hypothetical protein